MPSTEAARTAGAVRATTESLFAGDDSAKVDAFHAATTWARSLSRAQATRIDAFLTKPVLWELVSRSHNAFPAAPSIALPDAELGAMTLQDALLRRRSLAGDAPTQGGAIGIDDLAAILQFSYGVVGEQRAGAHGPLRRLRPCPSAGALYPLEIYPVVRDVTGLAAGVYHYDAVRHALSCLRADTAAGMAPMPGFDFQPGLLQQASVVLVVTAVLLRSTAKYLERGYRFVMNEAGALSQNMHLASVARGLSGCVWGGFCDADVAAYVGADGAGEIVVLGFIVGKKPFEPGGDPV